MSLYNYKITRLQDYKITRLQHTMQYKKEYFAALQEYNYYKKV